MRSTSKGDPKAIDAALEALKLGQIQKTADIQAAKQYLRNAMASVKSGTLFEASKNLIDVRTQLISLLETQRETLRRLVREMAAEDLARRTLCAPSSSVAVSCEGGSVPCKYYSSDPNYPLPCGDLLYLNAFPVAAVSVIYEDSEAYFKNVEFFVRLEDIGTVRPITETSFRSPQEVFGDALKAENLLPKDFLERLGYSDLAKHRKRIEQAITFIGIFLKTTDSSKATKENILKIIEWKPMIEFNLDGLSSSLPANTSYKNLPNTIKAKLNLLGNAIGSLESFGSALSNRIESTTDKEDNIEDVHKFAVAF